MKSKKLKQTMYHILGLVRIEITPMLNITKLIQINICAFYVIDLLSSEGSLS